VPVGDYDGEVEAEMAEPGREHVADRTLGLEDAEAGVERGHLHGRGNEGGTGASLGAVGLRDHGRDVDAPAEQLAERRHGELRRAEERDAHHSGRADAGCTSVMVGASPCSRFHRARRSRRRIKLR
jgi:hypothetical protein